MPNSVTRGEIISIIFAVPIIAVAASGAAFAADDSGGTKAQYKYVSNPGPNGAKCAGCSLFISPAACSVVEGKISPGGYCIAYAPK
jgi:hypothetical protein